ncbi:unnamed protein product [Choristocarpus tenellus]
MACLLMYFLVTVGVIVVAAVAHRRRKIRHEIRLCFGRLELVGFKSDKKLHLFEVSQPLSLSPTHKPFKNGVVLIGGFGDNPAMWSPLASHLSQEGWYYLAPRTPGWGRTDFDEANRTTWVEWVVACRDALVAVQNLCDRVTVLGHSTGALMAAYVAETCSVDRLIFSGPNFLSNPNDEWAKRLLVRPVIGPLVAKYLGLVVKKKREGRPIDSLNVAAYEGAFYLTCFPVAALRQMWLLQDQLSRPWKVKEEVIMLMGDHDQSVAPLPRQVPVIRKFVPSGVNFCSCRVANAAHGLPTETQPIVDILAGVVMEQKGVLEKLQRVGSVENGH